MGGGREMKKCNVGPVIKHMNGYGFKITMPTPEEAKSYKELNIFIIKHDGYKIEDKKGFHERER